MELFKRLFSNKSLETKKYLKERSPRLMRTNLTHPKDFSAKFNDKDVDILDFSYAGLSISTLGGTDKIFQEGKQAELKIKIRNQDKPRIFKFLVVNSNPMRIGLKSIDDSYQKAIEDSYEVELLAASLRQDLNNNMLWKSGDQMCLYVESKPGFHQISTIRLFLHNQLIFLNKENHKLHKAGLSYRQIKSVGIENLEDPLSSTELEKYDRDFLKILFCHIPNLDYRIQSSLLGLIA